MGKYHVYRSLQIDQQLLNTRLHLCRVSKTNVNNNTSTLYCQIFNLDRTYAFLLKAPLIRGVWGV